MEFDFSNTKAVEEGKPMTDPGTIAVFNIDKVEFKDKGTENFEVRFSRDEDAFTEWFYLTEKAAARFVYFFQKVTDNPDGLPPSSEQGVIAALTDKSVALRVSGKINPKNGKGGPTLPYSAFARKPSLLQELKDRGFSSSETGDINAALLAIQTPKENGEVKPPEQSGSEADSF